LKRKIAWSIHLLHTLSLKLQHRHPVGGYGGRSGARSREHGPENEDPRHMPKKEKK